MQSHREVTSQPGLAGQAETAVSSEEVGTPGGRRRGGRFDREAALFAAFRREWGLKLAKALAAAFSKAGQSYRLNLDAFASAQEGCALCMTAAAAS